MGFLYGLGAEGVGFRGTKVLGNQGPSEVRSSGSRKRGTTRTINGIQSLWWFQGSHTPMAGVWLSFRSSSPMAAAPGRLISGGIPFS